MDMNNQDRIKQVINHFPDNQLVISEEDSLFIITADSGDVYDVCAFLKKTLQYDYLQFLTCVDRLDKLELWYFLYSYSHKGTVVLKTNIERLTGKIKSVSSIWKAADWHEREAYDLFGVIFQGHPGLKRILLEDDFKGHPLLKDYAGKNMIKLPEL